MSDTRYKLKDAAKAVLAVYLICVCIFAAYRAVEGVILFSQSPPQSSHN
jgi:hypothetical protein